MTELVSIAATALAIAGVALNNRRMRLCFVLWLISNGLCCAIHAHAGLWVLAGRDAVFFALAVEGWKKWGKEK